MLIGWIVFNLKFSALPPWDGPRSRLPVAWINGDAVDLAKSQLFAWESGKRGEQEAHLQANPTQVEEETVREELETEAEVDTEMEAEMEKKLAEQEQVACTLSKRSPGSWP